MPLTFAKNWSKYDDKVLTWSQACRLVRDAFGTIQGAGLKDAIDGWPEKNDNRVRIINGLHKSKSDTHLHMTVHIVAFFRTYHLWLSKNNNLSKVTYESAGANSKPGHVGNLWEPYYQNLADFLSYYPL